VADNITEAATKRWSSVRSARTAQVMTALVRHLHGFAREVELTEQEWLAGIEWITALGAFSDEKRIEAILASDVFGLSMLVVELNNRLFAGATPPTVLGPFHIEGSPVVPFGHDMSDGLPGTPLFITGKVLDLAGTPLAGAVLDIWQADAQGVYEAQLAEVDEARLRAKYQTREDGSYCVRTIAPIGYSVPLDGPVGSLVSSAGLTGERPAHIHFMLEHPGCARLITHLFPEGTPYLDQDAVFGVKDELVVSFVEQPAGPTPDGGGLDRPWLLAEYDFVLAPSVDGKGL
jgi:hydroxyquinol 1,2-dioxygenase